MTVNAFLYALAAGVLPSLIWLWFWLREDSGQPEPRSLLSALFFGGILAVVASVFAEKYVADMVGDANTRYFYWAIIEEAAKFIAVAVIALYSRYYDEPIDAMVYCITVAIGFAALENTLFIMNSFSSGLIAAGIVTGSLRFMGATLVHIVSSAAVGFALGLTFYKNKLLKVVAIAIGLCAAVFLHFGFNLSVSNALHTSETIGIFGWVWGAVVLLIVLFEEVKVVKPKLL